MPVAAVVSFRLSGTDGVSIESAKWCAALGDLGFDVVSVAGEGSVDHLVAGLAITPEVAPDPEMIERALDGADVVIVENLCSLPLNPRASRVVAGACAGRPTILHHHDLSWQRPNLGTEPPPDDPGWRHVTINELSRYELGERGINATTIYNRFDTSATAGDRERTRSALRVEPNERLFLQPTRALPRKNVSGGLAISGRLGATYWLLGPAEDGYGPELDRLIDGATHRVLRGSAGGGAPISAADAYAACDLVLMPSTWEGFGNPTVESAVHRRPLCIGPYPVARELAAFGFEWFPLEDPDRLERWLEAPDTSLLDHNWSVADAHFSLRELPGRLAEILSTLPVAF